MKDLPLTYLAIVFLLIAGIMSYYDINGFVHSIFGVCCGYFFHKATRIDEMKKNEKV